MALPMTLLRRAGVEERLGKGRSALYDDIKMGLMTPGVSIGSRAVAWPRREVDALVAARIAGKSNADIRQLVKRLVAERADALAAIRPDMAVQRKPGK